MYRYTPRQNLAHSLDVVKNTNGSDLYVYVFLASFSNDCESNVVSRDKKKQHGIVIPMSQGGCHSEWLTKP